MLWPCRSSQGHGKARPSREGRAVLWPWEELHGRGMASVNQTRAHCVNQMGKTHSKPLGARHAMCESALSRRTNLRTPEFIRFGYYCGFALLKNACGLYSLRFSEPCCWRNEFCSLGEWFPTFRSILLLPPGRWSLERSTVRVPNILGPTVWNLMIYVTLWQLESWCYSRIYGKFVYQYSNVLFIIFASHLLYMEQARA